jgi:hypothetical protein
MADSTLKITDQSGLTAPAITESLDQLALKQRILAQVAQSRRARESSNIDDKSVAIRARIQRRLAAQRQANTVTQAQGVETIRLAEADRKDHQAAAESQRTFPESEAVGAQASVQEGRDSMDHNSAIDWIRLHFADQGQKAAAEAPTSRRTINFRNQAAASSMEMQSEFARLQTKAQAEKERADFVAALLENVLSSLTSSLIKHQAKITAMQAQINALQGR